MKYIRLITNNENALFNNQFNESLNVKPNSQIALEGITFNVKPILLTIDTTNHQLIYKHSDNFTGAVLLDNFTYDKTNVLELLGDMTRKLNGIYGEIVDINQTPPIFFVDLNDERTLFGYEFKVFQDNSGNTNINVSQGAFIGFSEALTYYKTFEMRVEGVFTITMGRDDTANDHTQHVSPRSPIAKGCGLMRTSIFLQEQAPTENKGLIMGLYDKNPQINPPTSENDLDYYIHIRSQPNTILIKVKDDIIDTGVQTLIQTGADADTYDIITLGRKILFIQYGNTQNTKVVLGSFEYDNTEDYYGVYNPRDTFDNCKFKSPFFTTSPFLGQADLNENIDVLDQTNLGAKPAPLPSNSRTSKSFAMSKQLADFLGYNQFVFPAQGDFLTQDLSLVSNNQILTNIKQSFVVELLNMEIDSYDGLSNQRQNIISVIPLLSTDEGSIDYSPNNLIFVDIKNTQELALRNMRARILDSELNTIAVSGMSVITLVVL